MFSLSPGSKPSAGGGGGDWLGLGGGDDTGGLDLNNVPLKTSTPFPSESKESTSTQGNCIFQPSLFQVAHITLLFHSSSFPQPLNVMSFPLIQLPRNVKRGKPLRQEGPAGAGGMVIMMSSYVCWESLLTSLQSQNRWSQLMTTASKFIHFNKQDFQIKCAFSLSCSRLLPTFAGVLREKVRTRASFNKTPTNYISGKSLINVVEDKNTSQVKRVFLLGSVRSR